MQVKRRNALHRPAESAAGPHINASALIHIKPVAPPRVSMDAARATLAEDLVLAGGR